MAKLICEMCGFDTSINDEFCPDCGVLFSTFLNDSISNSRIVLTKILELDRMFNSIRELIEENDIDAEYKARFSGDSVLILYKIDRYFFYLNGSLMDNRISVTYLRHSQEFKNIFQKTVYTLEDFIVRFDLVMNKIMESIDYYNSEFAMLV